MAVRNNLFSLPPQRSSPSPTLSAAQSSPLASGTLRSYPVTASPFSSSPPFLFTQTSLSAPLPDLFDDFAYSEDMEEDFHRIDSAAAAIIEVENAEMNVSPPWVLQPRLPQNQKTWVVFCGKIPGVYDYRWAFPSTTE